ncbi:MAG: FtsX-like permease family protein [Bacteroidales bacterium]|jgi:ABC-type lipoprotein release transport system permease subunit|nr:FtsX-like permease family protein [Bacteroidales bacterium]
MKDIIKIAWRNLWRNRRRTIITASSIFFAIFFAIVMRSFQIGTYKHMVKISIESYLGYLQIQNPDYFDDPSIDNVFEFTLEMLEEITKTVNVKVAVPRIESFALASTGMLSKGVMLTGISPEKEKEMSNPEQKLVHYAVTDKAIEHLQQKIKPDVIELLKIHNNTSFSSAEKLATALDFQTEDSLILQTVLAQTHVASGYLSENDEGVLISDRLSKYLKVSVGDSIILIGQGYQGSSAAGIYPVRGIVKLPSPELDNKLVYMTLGNINTFLGLSEQVTSIAINIENTDEMYKTETVLKQTFENTKTCVKNWEELSPALKQQIESDSVSGILFLVILYVIIFFGIFGTLLMMISERMREFGIMVAIGMKKFKLVLIVVMEMLFLSLIGIFAGMAASVPVILYGYYFPVKLTGEIKDMMIELGMDPVFPFAWFGDYFYIQGVIVFIMILVACIYPVRTILKLNAIEAIRGK